MAQLEEAENQHQAELARKKEVIQNLNSELSQAGFEASQPGAKVRKHSEGGVLTQVEDADAASKSEERDAESGDRRRSASSSRTQPVDPNAHARRECESPERRS